MTKTKQSKDACCKQWMTEVDKMPVDELTNIKHLLQLFFLQMFFVAQLHGNNGSISGPESQQSTGLVATSHLFRRSDVFGSKKLSSTNDFVLPGSVRTVELLCINNAFADSFGKRVLYFKVNFIPVCSKLSS
jgi:hypothetical protein